MKQITVEEEFKKNRELSRNELSKLMEWIEQQPHLPKLTEIEAILFFHACHFSMELTKQTIDIYFTIRTHIPEFFSGLNCKSDELQDAMSCLTLFPVEKPTPEGYRVYVGRLANFDASNFNFASSIKLFTMLFDLKLREDGTSPGIIIVMDQSNVTLGHVARLGPLTMKKFLYFLQDAAPIRIAGFHFINIVPFTDKILALMRPFMKKELTDVLHLHNNLDTLKEFIPLDILPKEYGGQTESGDELAKKIYNQCIENQSFFNELETRKVNEKLRPGKPKDASDLFGAEGNFKKLNID